MKTLDDAIKMAKQYSNLCKRYNKLVDFICLKVEDCCNIMNEIIIKKCKHGRYWTALNDYYITIDSSDGFVAVKEDIDTEIEEDYLIERIPAVCALSLTNAKLRKALNRAFNGKFFRYLQKLIELEDLGGLDSRIRPSDNLSIEDLSTIKTLPKLIADIKEKTEKLKKLNRMANKLKDELLSIEKGRN